MSGRAVDRPLIGTLGHLAAVALLAAADYASDPQIELRPFYLVPVLTAALFFGRVPALATAVAAAAAVLVVNDLGRIASLPLVLGLGLVRVATFAAVAVLVSEVRRQRGELQREATLREEYIALVGHELRNPLAGIKAAAGVLAGPITGSERATKLAAGIGAEAAAGLQLLDDLAVVTTLESGRLSSALIPIDLAELAERTVTAAEHGDRRIGFSGSGAGLRVLGDEHRIAQVIRNLLSNAAKYAPTEASIEVTVGITRDRDAAVITVRDHGAGIPPAERERLFQKFARLSTAGTARGSGLGLYISQRIAADHGGRLVADWPPGGGTAFSLSIPLLRD